MNVLLRNIVYLIILGLIVVLVSFGVSLYLTNRQIDVVLQRPIHSFVELLSITDYRLLENREVAFHAYFGADRCFYLSEEESKIAYPYSSFGVDFEDEMEGCIDS